jgi:hypothetical protein
MAEEEKPEPSGPTPELEIPREGDVDALFKGFNKLLKDKVGKVLTPEDQTNLSGFIQGFLRPLNDPRTIPNDTFVPIVRRWPCPLPPDAIYGLPTPASKDQSSQEEKPLVEPNNAESQTKPASGALSKDNDLLPGIAPTLQMEAEPAPRAVSKSGLTQAGNSSPELLPSLEPAPPIPAPEPEAPDDVYGPDTAQLMLPEWFDLERGTPNSFLRSALFAAVQGKDRRFLKGEVLSSSKDVTVKFTGEQLNQEDLTVWDTLVHLTRCNPLGAICRFSAHELLKSMNLNTGGDEHRRLHKSIIRLNGAVVEIIHHRKRYFGTLIHSGVENEVTSHYEIKLNPQLIRLYGKNQWTAINWNQRVELRRKPLALALHGYFSSHNEPFPVKLETLQLYTGSRNASLRGFKRRVHEALTELVRVGFLLGFEIEGDLVKVART